MPTAKLRQDTVRPLAYVGAHNSPCIYWDDDIPCFGLRGYPADRRTDVVSYGVKYRKRLATLGRADALTLAEARKKGSSISRPGSPAAKTRRRTIPAQPPGPEARLTPRRDDHLGGHRGHRRSASINGFHVSGAIDSSSGSVLRG